MPPSPKSKKSSTIVLLSDNKSLKDVFLPLLHAYLLETPSTEFFEKDPPMTDGPLYTISRGDITVRVLDTPLLGQTTVDNTIDAIKRGVGTLPTIDAFVFVLDGTATKLGQDVHATLNALSSTFPRPSSDNICLAFVVPWGSKVKGYPSRDDIPEWVNEKSQRFAPITNMAEARLDIKGRVKEKDEDFNKELVEDFEDTLKRTNVRLENLFKYVDQCGVQAWDMKYLYRQATSIETELFSALQIGDAESVAQADVQKISRLVEEYCSLATSPDFMTHLGLVIELVDIGKEVSGVDTSVEKLRAARDKLQDSKIKQQMYPKGFTVC